METKTKQNLTKITRKKVKTRQPTPQGTLICHPLTNQSTKTTDKRNSTPNLSYVCISRTEDLMKERI
jgi:hypothetical protein